MSNGGSLQDLGALNQVEVTDNVSPEMKEVDVLDLMMIEYVMVERRTRKDIADKFEISKSKARSRMESLFERKLVNKVNVCSGCERQLSECECGRFNKQIFYVREEDEETLEMMRKFRSMVSELEYGVGK